GMSIDDVCPANTPADDWDMGRLQTQLHETFNVKLDMPRAVQDADELAGALWPQIETFLKKREDDLGTPFFLYFSRHFHLEEIDSSWIEHLKAMEQLREGIGLRGYGQKDPKQEYKKEGFNLFQEMTTNVVRNVGQKLFRVRIERQEEEE